MCGVEECDVGVVNVRSLRGMGVDHTGTCDCGNAKEYQKGVQEQGGRDVNKGALAWFGRVASVLGCNGGKR